MFRRLPDVAARFERAGRAFLPLALLAAAATLLAATPARSESCGMGNQCPVADGLAANPAQANPSQVVQLQATAHDPDGQLTRYDFTCADGTFSNGLTSLTVTTSDTITTVSWTAPATTASSPVAITVRVWDNGGFLGVPTSGNVSLRQIDLVVTETNTAPVLSALSVERSRLFLGESTVASATASDADGDPLAWGWSTNLGSVVPGSPGQATLVAPAAPGIATVTATVTDSHGASASASVQVAVGSAVVDRMLATGLATPQRVAADRYGNLFVSDRSAGGVVVLGATGGETRALLPVADISSVAVDWADRPVVASASGAVVLDRGGAVVLPLDPGEPLGAATDVAVDAASFRYAVLYGGSSRVVVFDLNGERRFAFGSAGETPDQLLGATSLAVSPSGEILVGDAGHGLVKVFDVAGNLVRSFGGRGSALGRFNQLQGLAVDPAGSVFAVDAFQSRVQVFHPDGTLREVLGSFGPAAGELMTPSGVAYLADRGQLVVTSLNSSSLHLFDFADYIPPPGNTPPSMPIPSAPADAAVLATGTPVVLEALNAVDPDFHQLRDQFELYSMAGTDPVLLDSWLVREAPGTTPVDVGTSIPGAGAYAWRVRAFDGAAWSGWSSLRTFTVSGTQPNSAPSAPSPLSPAPGAPAGVAPRLEVGNASDPDGNPLRYEFEVALPVEGTLSPVAASGFVVAGVGSTGWDVPAGALSPSQRASWRARAHDGFLHGPWSGWQEFLTPALELPDPGERGDLPGGDRTRADEVRYQVGPIDGDLPIRFQLWDAASSDEVRLRVNGLWEIGLPTGPAAAWSLTVEVTIPAAQLDPAGPNRLDFVHPGAGDPWGIRRVQVGVLPVPAITARGWNTVIDVEWAEPAELPSGSVLRLLRAFAPDGPFVPIAELPASQGVLRDTGLENERFHYYRAAWLFPDGFEGLASPIVSAIASATNGPTPITDLRAFRSGNDVQLVWTPVTSFPSLAQYEIYRDLPGSWIPDTGGGTNLYLTVSPFEGKAIAVGGADVVDDHWYSVLSRDHQGVRSRQ